MISSLDKEKGEKSKGWGAKEETEIGEERGWIDEDSALPSSSFENLGGKRVERGKTAATSAARRNERGGRCLLLVDEKSEGGGKRNWR